jgi:hypothetical protein
VIAPLHRDTQHVVEAGFPHATFKATPASGSPSTRRENMHRVSEYGFPYPIRSVLRHRSPPFFVVQALSAK